MTSKPDLSTKTVEELRLRVEDHIGGDYTPEVPWLDEICNRAMERDRLRRQRTEYDCRYTLGSIADFSGSHCPIDKPCTTCRLQSVEEERDRLRALLVRIDKADVLLEHRASCGIQPEGHGCDCGLVEIQAAINEATKIL